MPVEIEPFHAIRIGRLAHDLAAQGRSVIHMEFGQPSTGAPPAAIARAHTVLDQDVLGYWENPLLRERIAARYQSSYGVEVEPDRIVLTCGASPALVVGLLSLFPRGSTIAMARPGYVSYRNTVKAMGMVPLEIACGPNSRFQLTAEHIADLDPAPAGIIIASPANPTGAILPAAELEAIAKVCRVRGIRILSDEIYHGLSYVGPCHSILEFEPDAQVVNSFSKYFSMVGWRLGWLVASRERVASARALVSNLFLTSPSLSQHAALAAMDETAILDGHVETYRRNRALLLEALPKLGLTDIAPPDGAFYIWADVGHLTDDSMAFCFDLLNETGVAFAPGIDFDPVEGRHHIRISFAVSTPEVEEALRRVAPWFAAKR